MFLYFVHFVPLMIVALFASPEGQPTSISDNVTGYTLQARSISSEVSDSSVAVMSGVPLIDSKRVKIDLSRKRPVKHFHGRIVRHQEKSLEDIVTDQSLWGRDFPSVLSSLPAFSRAGEEQVSVFPDRILGRTKHTSRRQAEPGAAKLAQDLKATENVTPRSAKMASYMTKGRTVPRAEVFQLPDDRSFRISAAGSSVQYLSPGLSIADVERRLGKAEKVTTEVLDDGTDRRPVILTLHHYAGGAIIFVESDVNPNIGSVDRVFLNARMISTTLF